MLQITITERLFRTSSEKEVLSVDRFQDGVCHQINKPYYLKSDRQTNRQTDWLAKDAHCLFISSNTSHFYNAT